MEKVIMSREKSLWFAEEILLDAKLINCQLESGELAAIEEMLRAEAHLSRDPETGRLRPKKASEYTLRLIAEVLHFMKVDIEQGPLSVPPLAVAEQCLRLIRSCAASGMKTQTYITKDLNILDDMLSIFNEYLHPAEEPISEEYSKKFDSCMIALTQTLGNLVVNNPFNQTIIWDKFSTNIINALIGQNEKIASCAAMIVYNILLGQPNVFPDDVLLLNALAYMYSEGNSEFPHLIIEYLIGVENSYIEKLYNRLEPDTKLLILNLAYNILMSFETQDINVSVNFIKFIAHEFKVKSDCILKTVDRYVNSIEPQEVVYLLDIIAIASSMDVYMDCLQADVSLFINISFLLRSIHKLGKQENNFFSSINKLYQKAGRPIPENITMPNKPDKLPQPPATNQTSQNDTQSTPHTCDSSELLQGTETTSECTESESSEQYYECSDQNVNTEKNDPLNIEKQEAKPKEAAKSSGDKASNFYYLPHSIIDRKISDVKMDESLIKIAFAKNFKPDNVNSNNDTITSSTDNATTVEQKVDNQDDTDPPLITDSPEEKKDKTPDHTSPIHKLSNTIQNIIKPVVENVPLQQTVINTISPNIQMNRQMSVERGIEASENVIREMAAESSAQNVQQVMLNQQNSTVPQVETVIPNPALLAGDAPPKVISDPIPVKKSQNVSHEFDLSEQLQKILGISADKAIKTDNVDINKESLTAVSQPRTESHTPQHTGSVSTSVSFPPNEVIIQKPKVQVKIPNFKIDSPENTQKIKLGNFDNTGPKQITSIVESVEQHVAFGFKATLIRTLGNLCWKNQINKRQIRELEVIPVLLDCCNIDGRNPLIMQWVILAVRNLCENCPENQAVISSLTLREPVNNEVLSEMGLTLHTDAENNSIKLVPLIKK